MYRNNFLLIIKGEKKTKKSIKLKKSEKNNRKNRTVKKTD